MGKKANPALIGAFVLAAAALGLIGVIVFGSGALFRNKSDYILFFTGDVNGLSVGAPVKFKGVEVGAVTEIHLQLGTMGINAARIAEGVRIPVWIEIDNDKVARQGGRLGDTQERVNELIALGLRAQLQAQSFVTGLLFVQLDFHPETPATLLLPPDSEVPEIPTIPSALEQVQSAAQMILKKIEDMKLDQMVRAATEALDGVKRVANSEPLHEFLDELPATAVAIRGAATDLRQLATNLDAGQKPLLEALTASAAQLDRTLADARLTVGKVDNLIDPNSPLAAQLTAALREFAETARSIRLLADFLERNPGALLRGREVEAK